MQRRGRDVRVGDQERERAIAALGEHMTAGRLDIDEYDQRCGQVAAARFVSDLTPLFDDLPGSPPGFLESAGSSSSRPAPQTIVVLVYAGIILVPLALVTRQFWLLGLLIIAGALLISRRSK